MFDTLLAMLFSVYICVLACFAGCVFSLFLYGLSCLVYLFVLVVRRRVWCVCHVSVCLVCMYKCVGAHRVGHVVSYLACHIVV